MINRLLKSKLYNMAQAADMVGIPPSSFWHLVRNERLLPGPAVRLGRRRVYDDAGIEEVKRLVAQHRANGTIKTR